MTPERWQHIQDIFDHAADLTREERAKYVESRCVDDPELRLQVERLLDSSDKVEDVFEKAIGGSLENVMYTSG